MQNWEKLDPFHGNFDFFSSLSLVWLRIMQLCRRYLQRQGQLGVLCNLKKFAPSIGSKLLWRYMKSDLMLLFFSMQFATKASLSVNNSIDITD